MRRMTVGLLAATAVAMFTFQAFAADSPERRGEPSGHPMMFQRLDKNRDGKISADEIPAGAPDFVKEMLKRADKDGDKAVTAEEFRAALPQFPGGPPGMMSGFAGRRPDGPADPQGPFTGRPGAFEQGGAHGCGPRAGMTPLGRRDTADPDRAGLNTASSGSRPDPKAIFARLDKDGDKKLSLEEFAEGMKMFHAQAPSGRGPMMGRGPLGPPPGMRRPPLAGRGPMMGRGPLGPPPGMGPPMAGRGPMMGPGPLGPHPGMGRAPMMGVRGAWGPPAWARSPWAWQTWAGAGRRWPPMGGRGAPWARQSGPMAGHAAAILGRLQAADKDKDGKLSKSEAPERLRQHFDKIDTNKDGQLDKAELAKAFHALRQQAREAMAKRGGEVAKKMHEAREKAVEKKHGEAKKPSEKKGEKKKVDEEKPAEKKG